MEGADALRREIAGLAAGFAESAREALERALERNLEELVARRSDWFETLDPDTATALRRAAGDAIARAGALLAERLRDPDLWLSPTVVLDERPGGAIDHPNHRVWIAILGAARPLDPVLGEFGVPAGGPPDPGGGHFGLQPRSAGELDPKHRLAGVWGRYLRLYDRYLRATATDPDEARRRWRGLG